jgi:hypothetical protein
LQGLEQQTSCQSRFANAGGADENDVFGTGNEVETSEASDKARGFECLPCPASCWRGLTGERVSIHSPCDSRIARRRGL